MQFTDLQDTIVALATPAGAGAIGIIRLSGQEAISIVNTFFAAKDLQKVPSHSIHLGYIRNEENQIIDQALVSVFKTPQSYTKENIIEISCHGSQYILQQLLELCCRSGARMAREGEFTMRAFLNGQMDLIAGRSSSRPHCGRIGVGTSNGLETNAGWFFGGD